MEGQIEISDGRTTADKLWLHPKDWNVWKNIEKDHKRCDGRVNDKSERQDDLEGPSNFQGWNAKWWYKQEQDNTMSPIIKFSRNKCISIIDSKSIIKLTLKTL